MKTSFLILCVSLFFVNVYSQQNELPSGGKIISGNDVLVNHPSLQRMSSLATIEARAVATPISLETLLVNVSDKTNPPSAVNIRFHIEEDIRKGDLLAWQFYIRSPWSEDESGDGKMGLTLVNPKLIEPGDLIRTVTAGEAWKHIVLTFRAPSDMQHAETFVVLHLGYAPQSIEISPVQLINYGSAVDEEFSPRFLSTYEGREPDASWRKPAAQRIEKHRKSDIGVRVTDKDGHPVEGAAVQIKMQRHSFGFGTSTNISHLIGDTPDNQKYREYFLRYFNKTATEQGLRWENWFTRTAAEREELKLVLDTMFAWFKTHDIPVRGHHLNWAKMSDRKQPEHVRNDPDMLKKEYMAFQDWLAEWVGDRVTEWDAINHIAGDMVGPGKTYADLFGMEIWAEMMVRAREVSPKPELWINEGAILPRGRRVEAYLDIVRFLLDAGAPLDGVGFMGHFRESSLTPPEEIYERLDQFASLIPSLQLTEMDVEVGDDELLQADYFRDLLTISFSHPAMKGIVLWGFWEGRHWRPDAALWRTDWSIKPAGQVWIDLIYRDWWSDETGLTGTGGDFAARVFKGDHEITVTHNGKAITRSVHIDNDQKIVIVID